MENTPIKKEVNRESVLALLLLLVLTLPSITALPLNYGGSVMGECREFAIVNMSFFSSGNVGNPAFRLGSQLAYANSVGVFGNATSYNEITNPTVDVQFRVTNPSCSASATGTNTSTGHNLANPAIFNVLSTNPVSLITPINGNAQTTNLTVFDWTHTHPTASYMLLISNTTNFAVLERNITGIAATTYTFNSSEALNDGTYYWRIMTYNRTEYMATSSYASWQVAAGAASLTSITPANTSWQSSTTISATVITNIPATCAYSQTSGSYASKTPMSNTGGTTHTTTLTAYQEGRNYFYFQCNTSVVSQERTHYFLVDTTAPDRTAAVLHIENDATYTNDTTLSLNWSGFSDGTNGSGINRYYYSFTNSGGSAIGTWTGFTTITLAGATEGTEQVYVWARDAAGNIGLAATDSIIVDTTPPSMGSWSTSPADLTKYSTGSFTVTVTITDSTPLNGLPQFRYRVGNDTYSAYAATTSLGSDRYRFSIPEGSGANSWWNRAGDYVYYDVIAYDTFNELTNLTRSEFINNQTTAPVFHSISAKSMLEDTTLTFNLTGVDVDFNYLTYGIVTNTTDLDYTITAINATRSSVSISAENDDVGTHTLQFYVTDQIYTIYRNVTLTVINVNDAPVLSSIGNLVGYQGAYFNLTLNASDVDDTTLIFSSNSTFFSVNPITGHFGFTPLASNRGVHSLVFRVRDGSNAEDNETVTFTVNYCGNNICEAAYETCGRCAVDCGVCGDEESKALLIEPVNCVNKTMTIEVAKLVERGTCYPRGEIIRNMEVCGRIASETISVSVYDEDVWVELEEVTSDVTGAISWTPTEVGLHKLSFSSGSYEEVEFTTNYCGKEETSSSVTQTSDEETDNTKKNTGSDATSPTAPDRNASLDGNSRWFWWTLFTILFLLAAYRIIKLAYINLVRSNKTNIFVKSVDWLIKLYFLASIQTNQFLDDNPKVKHQVKKMKRALHTGIEFSAALAASLKARLNLFTKVNVPFFAMNGEGEASLLVAISLMKMNSKDSLGTLFDRLGGAKVHTLQALCATLRAQGINAMLRTGTLIDIKTGIDMNEACVLDNGKTRLIIMGYDTNVVYAHDYENGIKCRKIPDDDLERNWNGAFIAVKKRR
ncbi:MAG: hypothetical protein H6502_01000 [Candidatus Woesearchaeota archaeon]|nr:MAG: hypothetical protein H6502_01000 [Candidatus Woesearchaeota archaeon]